jgi:hypothetical protein
MSSKRSTLLEYLRNTLLPGVTTGNGYNYTLATIERGHRNFRDLMPTAFPAVFVSSTQESRENINHVAFNAILKVALVGYVKNTEATPNASGTGVQLDLDKLIEDLTKVLEADRLQGGRVYNTEIVSVDTDEGDMAPYAMCVVVVEFKYATEGTAP